MGSRHPIDVVLLYDAIAGSLTEVLTDTVTGDTYTHTYDNVNLADTLGPTAYVGFTGGQSSGYDSTQTIRDFRFLPGNPTYITAEDAALVAPAAAAATNSAPGGQEVPPANVTAGHPTLSAGYGIGSDLLSLSTRVSSLAANAGRGSLHVKNGGPLTLVGSEMGQGLQAREAIDVTSHGTLQVLTDVASQLGQVALRSHGDLMLVDGHVLSAPTLLLQGGFEPDQAFGSDWNPADDDLDDFLADLAEDLGRFHGTKSLQIRTM